MLKRILDRKNPYKHRTKSSCMLRFFIIVIVTLLSFGTLHIQAQRLHHVQGDVIVQLNPGKDVRDLINTHQRYRGGSTDLKLVQLLSKPLNIWLLHFDWTIIHDRNFLYQLQKDPIVIGAQFNHFAELRSTTPNDDFFERQWHFFNTGQSGGGNGNIDLDIDLAWDVTTGGLTPEGDTIVVCVIDNGQDLSHEDFGDNLWINHAEIPNNGIDDDNNGYLDDYRGWHTGKDNDEIDDENDHGTPVAGIIGAKGNNGIGVSGVNWDVKIMTVTAGLLIDGAFDEAQLIQAYNYALVQRKKYNETQGQEGAFVVAVNSSFGIGRRKAADFPVWCGLFEELGVEGILSPVAADDRGGSYDVEILGDIPTVCQSDFVVAVTNADNSGALTNRAAFGNISVDLAAFGESIWTTDSGNSYSTFSGTSASTPLVAGAIALLYSAPCESLITLAKADPPVAAQLVKQYLLEGVVPNATLDGKSVSGGYLNINNSMERLLADCADCIASTSYNVSAIDDQSALLEWNTNPTIKQTNLRWKSMNDSEWNVIEDASAPFQLEGLIPCTDYEFQLRDSCESMVFEYDDSFVFQTLGCCAAPSQVTFGIIEEDLALVQWPDEFGAEAYDFRYRKMGSEDWINRTTFGNSFGLTGLDTCTTYQIQIAISCDGTTNFTDLSQIFMFTTLGCGSCLEADYCVPARIDASEEWIAMVKVNDFENRSESDNGYGDYTELSLALEQGRTHDFAIQPGFAGSVNRNRYTQIWIDLDQNGSFTSNELLYESENATNDLTTASIEIPDGIQLGKTRLRVSMLIQSGIGACSFATDQFGEFEDYCIDIITNETTNTNNTQIQDILFQVNPNPVLYGEVILNTQFPQAIREYSLDWLTADGKLVQSMNFKNHPANNIQTKRLDVSSLEQGIYFLRFQSVESRTLVQKVIIVK